MAMPTRKNTAHYNPDSNAGRTASSIRSHIMSRIKSKDTKAELLLRRGLWKRKIRFRIHADGIAGKPDILIKKYRLAIFIDGGFWHGYDWLHKREKIKTNTAFWIAKIERNMQRDKDVNRMLSDQGFTVMRFWDHQVLEGLPKCLNQVMLYIESCRLATIPERQ